MSFNRIKISLSPKLEEKKSSSVSRSPKFNLSILKTLPFLLLAFLQNAAKADYIETTVLPVTEELGEQANILLEYVIDTNPGFYDYFTCANYTIGNEVVVGNQATIGNNTIIKSKNGFCGYDLIEGLTCDGEDYWLDIYVEEGKDLADQLLQCVIDAYSMICTSGYYSSSLALMSSPGISERVSQYRDIDSNNMVSNEFALQGFDECGVYHSNSRDNTNTKIAISLGIIGGLALVVFCICLGMKYNKQNPARVKPVNTNKESDAVELSGQQSITTTNYHVVINVNGEGTTIPTKPAITAPVLIYPESGSTEKPREVFVSGMADQQLDADQNSQQFVQDTSSTMANNSSSTTVYDNSSVTYIGNHPKPAYSTYGAYSNPYFPSIFSRPAAPTINQTVIIENDSSSSNVAKHDRVHYQKPAGGISTHHQQQQAPVSKPSNSVDRKPAPTPNRQPAKPVPKPAPKPTPKPAVKVPAKVHLTSGPSPHRQQKAAPKPHGRR